jgi:hypothetical protein
MWLFRRILGIVVWVALGAWAYYDVFVSVPDYCARVTACIPLGVLITGPLVVIAPILVLIDITRIVVRWRKERRVPPDDSPAR